MSRPTRFSKEMMESYLQSGDWGPTTWSSLWDRNAEKNPNKEAIVDSSRRLTWAQAGLETDRMALGLLEAGIKKDEAIVFQVPNSVELCLMRVACEKAGILFIGVMVNLRHREMKHILKCTEAAGIVIPWKYRGFDHFNMVQEIRSGLPLRHVFVVGDEIPEGTTGISKWINIPLDKAYPQDYLDKTRFYTTDVSMIALTTGTTGKPKFVEHVLCSFTTSGKAIAQRLRMTSEDVVALLPYAAAGPNNAGYWGAPWVSAKIVLQGKYETDASLRLIEKERVTIVCMVPAQLSMILRHEHLDKYDLSSVRIWRCGGAPLPYQLGLEAEEKLPGVVINGFGSVDSGVIILNSVDAPRNVRLRTVGKPTGGHKVKIVDDYDQTLGTGEAGEIWLGGSLITSGYFKDPEATWQCWTNDGWFKTGDLGKLDEDGNLIIVGRKKDMINRGGQNIYPVEIENILLTHPKVSNVAIVAMPDPIMIEKACAFIVPKSGKTFLFEEMISFLKSKQIVAYKLPERLEIVKNLPVVGDQKINKMLLRRQIAQKLEEEGGL